MKRSTPTLLLSAIATAVLTACSGTETGTSGSPEAAPKVPAYKITHQDTDGNQRRVTIKVTSAKGLRAVFNDAAAGLKDDAGYFVEINCTTGGTGSADNRLANGKKAVGHMGAASTGLADGKTEFEEQQGATCPAK
ncbi:MULTISPECIES: hypothetical protein [Streptomyces]|uniref:Lipoprotein n=1 Tax=Streptomyces doudnae TaxID=3075536 RepID=A0ABD5EVC1_9ACTN|nr:MULTISPECIES: hypothetical protein [unclassified Streptomyces]MDT0438676.1 hypothetical protein [Streptomyces sp. DSM 41981]MYQ62022.1 hypothetical protein [Streptomyces sp. SID4950]SCD28637.1 hypothetical protein GA0115242_10074 [Streptomyces sp. SolWspMP-5a-2]